MTVAKETRALLAQSLYEELAPADRHRLDEALDASSGLRDEAEALRRMVEKIPVGEVSLGVELTGAVRARLRDTEVTNAAWWRVPRWVLVAAAFTLVASGVTYRVALYSPAAVAPEVRTAAAVSPDVDDILSEVDGLVAKHRFAEAHALLATAAASLEGLPEAAAVRQRMADMAFEDLQWYAEAFAGYDLLRRDYTDQFTSAPHNFLRLNLLDEARGPEGDYASLRMFDAARRDGSFMAMEKVVARYPVTYVASLAASEMASSVADSEGFALAGRGRIRALRIARTRTTNPVVKGQLRIEMAHTLRRELNNPDRARDLYQSLAQSPVTVIAQSARRSLEEMNTEELTKEP